jgi:hypothetical protein
MHTGLRRTLLRLGVVAGILGLSALVLAQVSTHYDLGWHLLSGGGGARSSTTYRVDDSLGQWVSETSASTSAKIEPGFWYGMASAPCTRPLVGVAIEAPPTGYIDTTYSFVGLIDPDDATAPIYYEWSPEPVSGQGTPGATYQWATGGSYTVNLAVHNCGGTVGDTHTIDISASGPVAGDSYEVDDTCATASTILADGTPQTHTFHRAADQDWVKFSAEAGKTYVIETSNVGADHDAVLYLYDACAAPALGSEENAFGQTVRLEWNTPTAGTYYLMLQQYNTEIFGPDTQYDLTVRLDATPPSTPKSPRSAPADGALILQWKRSPELDVAGYEVCWSTISGTCAGIEDVDGAGTTYCELGPTVGGLTNGTLYYIRVRAKDYSNNKSAWTSEISNIPSQPVDATLPSVAVSQPTAASSYSTSLETRSFGGSAQDIGGNLSRVKVRNVTKDTEGWDYSLTGSSHTFHVDNIGLNVGSNAVQVTVYDDAGNQGTTSLTVSRLGQATDGVVIVVAGHNVSYGLQTNIYNLTNRAYRVFQGAGYSDDAIYYLAPTSQAPYGDGVNKVDATATPANLQYAIETWAPGTGRLGPGKPLYIYMMDHGLIEGFCADGCGSSEQVTSTGLNTWLNTLETATGTDTINVIYEACHSGSFVDRVEDVAASISEPGRVIIVSTGRTNNAYASAQGAYFSDAFFSCVVESGSLKTCYDQAASAVSLTGNNQTPWLDDNGDGLSNPTDGSVAQNRYIASAFGSFGPQILSVSLEVSSGSGTLAAQVERGAEEIDLVWAAVYPPSFQEPVSTTLNLGVPVVLLQADPVTEGHYTATYPSGFTEEGQYRVVYYAQDRAGIQAQPKLATTEKRVYLPAVLRNYAH